MGFLERVMWGGSEGSRFFGGSDSSGMVNLDDVRAKVVYVALGRCVKDDSALRAFGFRSEAFLCSVARELGLNERLVNEEMVEAFDSAMDRMPRESAEEVYRRLWDLLPELPC